MKVTPNKVFFTIIDKRKQQWTGIESCNSPPWLAAETGPVRIQDCGRTVDDRVERNLLLGDLVDQLWGSPTGRSTPLHLLDVNKPACKSRSRKRHWDLGVLWSLCQFGSTFRARLGETIALALVPAWYTFSNSHKTCLCIVFTYDLSIRYTFNTNLFNQVSKMLK